MNPDLILADVAHRPWPLPAGPWIMYQTWHDLVFAHWPIAPDVMRTVIPPSVELDTYDGMAWIGIVPFRMSNVRPRYVPPLPGLSALPELNVRTYVRSRDPADPKPGVYFFSLDASKRLVVAAARLGFRLPYFHAAMSLRERQGVIDYCSVRIHRGAPPASFRGRYGPIDGIYHSQPGDLDHWLTERYCLYTTDRLGEVYRAEIHHPQWPLQPADAEITDNTMALAAGIDLPDTAPLLHFSRRNDVLVWPLTRVPAPG